MRSKLALLTLGLTAGLALPGCGETMELPGRGECELACPDAGIEDGNANISGILSVDAFFASVLSVRDTSASIEASMRGELLKQAASLELEVDPAVSVGQLAMEVSTAIQERLETRWKTSLKVQVQAPECRTSLELAAQLAAECDVGVEHADARAECRGSCEIDAASAADCHGEATLTCSGVAPSLDCAGTCAGTCSLDLNSEARCEGTCRGTCRGDCSLRNTQTEACEGHCDGMCEGRCELDMTAGGSCEGRCEGTCEWQPTSGGCKGGATARCEDAGAANLKCLRGCDGEVRPPKAAVECEAATEAKTSAKVECVPPQLTVNYDVVGDVDSLGRSEFRVWLTGFKASLQTMAILQARAEALLRASAKLTTAAQGAVYSEFDAATDRDLSLKVKIGLGCALPELERVPGILIGSTSQTAASIEAFALIAAAVSE